MGQAQHAMAAGDNDDNDDDLSGPGKRLEEKSGGTWTVRCAATSLRAWVSHGLRDLARIFCNETGQHVFFSPLPGDPMIMIFAGASCSCPPP